MAAFDERPGRPRPLEMSGGKQGRATRFCRFDRLVVNHDRVRFSLTTLGRASGEPKHADEALPQPALPPIIDAAPDRLERRQVLGPRKLTPLANGAF
jgi:hypothetical protein